MMNAVARWVCRGVSLLLLGPIAAWAAHRVLSPDGSHADTLLTGQSLVAGLVALAIVAACVLVASAVSAKASDRHEAVLNAGFVLAWVGWSGGRVGDLYRQASGVNTMVRMIVEGGLILGVVLVGWAIADAVSRRSSEDEGLATGPSALRGALTGKAGVPVVIASAVAALACTWLFGRYDAPGQSIGAAFLGGIAAGVVGTLVYQSASGGVSMDKGITEVYLAIAFGVLLCGILAPVITMVVPGTGKLVDGVAKGNLPGWAVVSPVSWSVGALIGVPVGVSFFQNKAEEAAPARAA